MAGTVTKISSMTNVFRTFITSALLTREHVGVMDKLVDIKRLDTKQGKTWNEPYFGAVVAQALTDGQAFDAPTLFNDAGNFSITPSEVGVQILYTKRMDDQITEDYAALAGKVMANAIEYKRDVDGLGQFANAGGSVGSSSTFVLGLPGAALAAIRAGRALSGATARTNARATGDPGEPPFYIVIHEFSRYDLASQLGGLFNPAGAGTSIGTTAASNAYGVGQTGVATTDAVRQWQEEHVAGMIHGSKVIIDNNFTIATTYTGGVHARNGLVHLKYRRPIDKTVETVDGRALKMTLVDDYGWGKRNDVWVVKMSLDATAPST